MSLGLLASGGLGFDLLKHLLKSHQLCFVMTDLHSRAIIEECQENNLPCFIGNPRNGKAKEFVKDKEIDILVSVNYLFIIEEDLISLPKRLAFNIHGSLLPKYRGRTPHVWAIINNEKETGITAHVIDDGCDTGDVLEQIVIPIAENATGADVLLSFGEHYPILIDTVLAKIENNTLSIKPQQHALATVFGKRTPDDGTINWDWQKERIYNWVRAQAYPYPGAFSFYNNEKITIDEVSYSSLGYDWTTPNGTVIGLNKGNPIVKTPNGAVEIRKIRNEQIKFQVDEQFSN